MRCPSCGALQNGFNVCSECGQELSVHRSVSDADSPQIRNSENGPDGESVHTSNDPSPASRLIEFPGLPKSAVPLWRKEIAERVREAQERKAREALETNGGAEGNAAPQLELLSQVETPEINPLVAAALKRIERAHTNSPSQILNPSRAMTALAYAPDNGYQPLVEIAPETVQQPTLVTEAEINADAEQSAKTHNLTVVPTVTRTEEVQPPRAAKPRRVISDGLNSAALNYLDSVPTTLRVEDVSHRAPVPRRFAAGLIDLIVLIFLCLPMIASLNQALLPWQNPQAAFFTVSTVMVMGFFYSTVATALTGRTLGMRLLNLRVVDSRTGLIPTGSQSAARSLLYLFSLVSAGLVLVYALLDEDRRTAHDRFTKTDVIAC